MPPITGMTIVTEPVCPIMMLPATKAAYRNIEQAWLQLAPGIDSRRKN
jgi:hypothetical protein